MILNAPKSNKRKSKDFKDLPPIPEKRYFSIGEVGFLCGVKPHVLRYWEQEFPRLKPVKRRGNRRYYQHKDVLMIRQIRKLLYEDGFTIEGARAQLIGNTEPSVAQFMPVNVGVKKIILDLESILQTLNTDDLHSYKSIIN